MGLETSLTRGAGNVMGQNPFPHFPRPRNGLLPSLSLLGLNAANDNFKGVASLFGSGTTDYRTSIW
jgi:hypothetical protein